MPAELLEKEAEVAEVPRNISEGVAVPQTVVSTAQETADQRILGKKSIWREIFEGHQEFLGWTPD
jgi:hypothetical protein